MVRFLIVTWMIQDPVAVSHMLAPSALPGALISQSASTNAKESGSVLPVTVQKSSACNVKEADMQKIENKINIFFM